MSSTDGQRLFKTPMNLTLRITHKLTIRIISIISYDKTPVKISGKVKINVKWLSLSGFVQIQLYRGAATSTAETGVNDLINTCKQAILRAIYLGLVGGCALCLLNSCSISVNNLLMC